MNSDGNLGLIELMERLLIVCSSWLESRLINCPESDAAPIYRWGWIRWKQTTSGRIYRQAHFRTISKTTEFFTAVESGNTERVRALLTADPALAKATDARGKALSQHARESGDEEIAHLFEERSVG
jgi:hypothetical protein